MFSSLFYISQSALSLPRDSEELSDIQFQSTARNSQLDLTGFLVATPSHFTQYLEGDAHSLSQVMNSIRSDARHYAIREWELPPECKRRFPWWRMATFPPGTFTSRHVEPLLGGDEEPLSRTTVEEILKLMQLVAFPTGAGR